MLQNVVLHKNSKRETFEEIFDAHVKWCTMGLLGYTLFAVKVE
jgi:hypothetical protein